MLPDNIDFDKVAIYTLNQVMGAIEGWLKGRPTDEVALMNRLTENFSKSRRGCDVGIRDKISMTNKVAMLHRKGTNQIDLYGADLAITIYVNHSFIKTALFQLKKGYNFSAGLERRQLNDGLADDRYKNKSFVMYADEAKASIRIKSISSLISQFNDTQDTKTFDTSEWLFLVEWLKKWMSCEEGELSDVNDKFSIERLLQEFIVEEDDWVSPWGFDISDNLFESNSKVSDNLPAKAWLVILFEVESDEISLKKKFGKKK